MQEKYYDNEGSTGNMNRVNHRNHNNNPEYWSILVKDTESGFNDKIGLDFGCGCGRNVINLANRFKRFDGVDISLELVNTSRNNLSIIGYSEPKVNFYKCNGVSLDILPSNIYDFIMSTIVLQHICVHEIRFNYFKEFFRIMKSGGLLSFQMGFGAKDKSVSYYDNYYEATSTNSGCDVRIENPSHLTSDLEKIGFINIGYVIRDAWDDSHSNWIYVKAYKP